MISFLTDITVDGVALWVVLLICVGVFLGAFMDAIAGGGGAYVPRTDGGYNNIYELWQELEGKKNQLVERLA